MSRNIVLVTWSEADKAYKGFHDVHYSSLPNINQLALIEKSEGGKIGLKDSDSHTMGKKALEGGLIGMIAGILGGPIGVLLGYSMGSLMGALADSDSADADEVVLAAISKGIPRGATALLVDIEEDDPSKLDLVFHGQEVTIQRWAFDEVESEVESAVSAYENAASEVKKTIRAEKKDEHKQQRKQKWDEFKAKFLMQRAD